MKLAPMFVVPALLVVSCASRPPGRDPCYLTAEATATTRALHECDGYESTAACPAWPAIAADLQNSQEACE